ncbi:MAG: tRNA-dihydrouridine synthase family protein [Muribaculaceae bacterium]
MNDVLKLFSAPLQGYTEATWRNIHNRIFGGIDTYYTPFMRVEKGLFRHKDVRDINPANNSVERLVPQIIGSNPQETKIMIDKLIELGHKQIDINLGCPFPLIAGRHKGSGMLPYPDEVKSLIEEVSKYINCVEFSIKMRLGWKDNTEAIALLPYLYTINPIHITLHPRLGFQQYKGVPDMESFKKFYSTCTAPIIYNGDINNIDDINQIATTYPNLKGIMIGRGLLSNPALAREYQGGKAASYDEILLMHDELLEHYSTSLQGDTQLLTKMKSYWEYFMPDIDKKLKKGIKKSSNMAKYHAAIQNIKVECKS